MLSTVKLVMVILKRLSNTSLAPKKRLQGLKDRLVNDGTLEFTPIYSATAALWERS